MVFRCFDPITGGRIDQVAWQESKPCGRKDSLPLSKEDDKFEKFCSDYSNFIDVSDSYEKFAVNWEKQKAAAGDTLLAPRRYPLILRALYRSFTHDLMMAFCGKLVWSILVIFSIWFFVFEILTFIRARANGTATDDMQHYEFVLCACFFVNMIALSIGIQQMGIYSSILGSKVKAALTTAIFKKMIIRDAYESKADIVSLVSKDVDKLSEACLSCQYLWSGIFETIAVLVVCFILSGTSVLPALGVMAVFLPLQYWMGMVVAFRKKKLATISKKRITMMEEILRAIKLIKIYGWEASFFNNIFEVREEEKAWVARINQVQATILGLIFCLPPLVSLAVFGTQELMGSIEPVLVFTTLSFFNTLRVPFSKLPKSLRDVLDAFSAMERIQEFLLEPELHPELAKKSEKEEDEHGLGIVFRKAAFSYGPHGTLVLSDINLNVPQGSLMMVAGTVAGGKSNLLKSILGDLTLREGTCTESHSRAYVPQSPWTALGTVRDNIVFGLPFEQDFYNKVIHACALDPDLEMMPEGDMTWIGERGGNLSGGQKQRIALARAAYSRADLYVLDSPLSAVDMYTCQHIFKFCIQEMMIGGGGTVVLATHQTELFSMSDHLVVMDHGKQVYNDRYTYSGIKHLFPNMANPDGPGADEAVPKVKKTPNVPHPMSEQQGLLVTNKRTKESKKLRPQASLPTPVEPPSAKAAPPAAKAKQGIYSWYFNILGWWSFALATLIFICGQIIRVYSDFWISVWTSRKYKDEGYTTDAFYAGLYFSLVFTFLCFSFLRAFYWLFLGRGAASKIHAMAFSAVLKAPMHIFHVTPVGNLLSFFSKDMDVIDDVLVDNMLMFQILMWIVVLAVGLVAYNLPLFLAIVGGLFVVYIYVVRVFVYTSVPLKQAAAKATGDVVAHTAETLSGLAVVRAFRMQGKFQDDNVGFQSRSTVVTFSIANLSLWLAFRVDIIGSLLVLACCLLAVLDTSMTAGIAGLIVSNSFQILLFFSIMSRFMGEVHDNMIAVENARKMSSLEAEHQPTQETKLSAEWPSSGDLMFDDVVMSYLPGQPPILKGVSFNIRPGEKIGVVGRTGAGKCKWILLSAFP